jgi:predicted MPP superfamily phosphohydrolase
MIFFFVVIIVLCLMYGYVGWRLIVPAAFSMTTNMLLWGLLATLLILPFIPILMRFRQSDSAGLDILAWIGYLGFGIVTLLFALLVTKDAVFLVTAVIQKSIHLILHGFNAGHEATVAVDPERRRMLVNTVNVGILAVTGGLTGYGMFQALRRPAIVEVNVPIKNLPKDLNGFTIVQITDIHASNTIKRPFIQTVVDMVNELKPDIVALTGDLVDGSVGQLGGDVAPLADLKSPHGLYFITGNHEYYSGVQSWLDETARLGFTNLMNEHRVIERGAGRLLLAGVTDFEGGGFAKDHVSDPHKAIAGAPPCHAKILLAHQPKSIFEAAKAGYDYVISGHTHGGQYFPYHFLVSLAQPYTSGLHQYDNTRIYVSRGTGYWGPQLRIAARSEITVHRLTSA